MKTIAFFNNKGGVGKTSLAYHLAWTFADRGHAVVVADLDPQANLTSMFLDEERLEELWPDGEHPETVLGSIQPILNGTGDVQVPHVEQVRTNLGLIVGDLGLSWFEDKLSREWPACLDRQPAAFRVVSSFHRMVVSAARKQAATLALIDVGPNLGTINRAALLAADHVVVPLAPDLFSLQGLRNLGPTLSRWREEWMERRGKKPSGQDIELPLGLMKLEGYVVLQHAMRMDRPVRAYGNWMARIPGDYRRAVLEKPGQAPNTIENDSDCLGLLRNYRSLMPLAMEARKPMFALKAADGAIGSHFRAVQDCRRDFDTLADKIAERCGIAAP